MILIKSAQELEKMRIAGRKAAQIMAQLEKWVKPGVTDTELDQKAAEFFKKEDSKAAFKGYMGYPANICVSINHEVVHGIPRNRVLKDGDIVGIDLGTFVDGFYGDIARTFAVGDVPEEVLNLIRVTEEAFWKGVDQCICDHRLGDVSNAIEQWVVQNGYSVVRDFVGHGIGRKMHEDPPVPNFGKPKSGPKLQAGMVLAIEPMVNEGTSDVWILKDGWTVVTRDGKLSSHYENTVAITENGPEILTKI